MDAALTQVRPTWAEWKPSGSYTVGAEEELMLLNPHDWSLAQQVERVLPVLGPGARGPRDRRDPGIVDRAQHQPPSGGRLAGRGAGRTALGSSSWSSRASAYARPAPAHTRSRSGTRRSLRPSRATRPSTARCGSSHDASRRSRCTSTSALRTPRPRSGPSTGCAPTCRCCSRSRSTPLSGRDATRGWPPLGRPSSSPSRGSESRAGSATMPSGSRPSTC